MDNKNVLIIGGGTGGVQQALEKTEAGAKVTVIDTCLMVFDPTLARRECPVIV